MSKPHTCLRCLGLPPLPADWPASMTAENHAIEYQPRSPRKIDERAHPRRPLCPSHWLGTECLRCAELPLALTRAYLESLAMGDADTDPYFGPRRPWPPRKIHPKATPGKPLCGEHWREDRSAKRQANRVRTSRTVYGLDPEDRADLLVLQDGKCPICGRGLDEDNRGRLRATAHDHDHDLAREHDHPEDKGCPECMRGLTCGWCNTELLIRIDLAAAERLVAYYRDPPMAQLRRARAARGAS